MHYFILACVFNLHHPEMVARFFISERSYKHIREYQTVYDSGKASHSKCQSMGLSRAYLAWVERE